MPYSHSLSARLMRYVQIDTTADPNSLTCPSSIGQWDLLRLLERELLEMGYSDVILDENGYLYALIPATKGMEDEDVICFCSHVDTAPDCGGAGVKPRLISGYDGSRIYYPDAPDLYLCPEEHPYLKERIGDDLITGSGLTLLGADDKAGVSIIMDLANLLSKNSEIKHGPIRILFTPDEEIGRGVDKVNMSLVSAAYGYTLDGGERGSLEGETFSADSMEVKFYGVSAHPGYAKDLMVNASKVAASFIDSLPHDSGTPETTSGREGFVHIVKMFGGLEESSVNFILRDFERSGLDQWAMMLTESAERAIKRFPGSRYTLKRGEQYRNMKEVLEGRPEVMLRAERAFERVGLKLKKQSIRGGTDGSRLSYMGLPCPNIFTGEMAIHSRVEYCFVQDMEKALEVLVEIIRFRDKDN
jgi:tripeptide aminopeptidase